MTAAAHWDTLYGRPSLRQESILVLVAILLHTPLFLLKMKAPARDTTDPRDRVINVAMMEDDLERIRERIPGAISPPGMVDSGRVFDLRKRMKQWAPPNLPVVPPAPLPSAPPLSIQPGPVPGKRPGNALPALAHRIGPVSLPGAPGVGTPGMPLAPSISPLVKVPPANIVDRGVFATSIQPIAQSKTTLPSVVGTGPIAGGPGRNRDVITLPAPPTGHTRDNTQLKGLGRTGNIVVAQGPERGGEIVSSKPAPTRIDTTDVPIPLPPPVSRPIDLIKPVEVDRVLSQFPIEGALADRDIVYQETPQVPEWFREKGVEASVTLKFSVRPDGVVRDDIEIAQYSGYPRLDEHAKTVLRRWRFAPLVGESRNLHQSGTVTFRFSVR